MDMYVELKKQKKKQCTLSSIADNTCAGRPPSSEFTVCVVCADTAEDRRLPLYQDYYGLMRAQNGVLKAAACGTHRLKNLMLHLWHSSQDGQH